MTAFILYGMMAFFLVAIQSSMVAWLTIDLPLIFLIFLSFQSDQTGGNRGIVIVVAFLALLVDSLSMAAGGIHLILYLLLFFVIRRFVVGFVFHAKVASGIWVSGISPFYYLIEALCYSMGEHSMMRLHYLFSFLLQISIINGLAAFLLFPFFNLLGRVPRKQYGKSSTRKSLVS